MSPDLIFEDQRLRVALERLCEDVKVAGGRALLVGGAVRDAVLGLPAKELDIEIYGIEPEHFQQVLSKHFEWDLVGRVFGTLKIRSLPIDVSFPCRRLVGKEAAEGWEDVDPFMDLEEAASRRDFTMNAMMLDPLRNELLDPFGGLRDLNKRQLRHTSDKFVEDPLRVLRAMQFVARFDLQVVPETVIISRTLTPAGLAPERIFEEWKKWVLRGVRPSRGLAFLKECGWVRYFPELEALIGCEQEQDWHPEGDVWIHTLHCMDAFAGERIGNDEEDLLVGFGVLCHDLGKPATTRRENGRITSKGHDQAGDGPTRSFLGRMTNQEDLIDAVVPLVLTHLRPRALYKAQAGDSAIRRLAREVGRIDRLVRVARADDMGRPPQAFDGFPAGTWLLARARALEVEHQAPRPLVMGRHLLALGLTPGPRIGQVLEACYEAQLDGTFSTMESGIAYAKGVIERES